MWSPFAHHFGHHHPVMGCCCGPWGWHTPDKEQQLQWLNFYKEYLTRELAAVEDEIKQVKKESQKDDQ